MRWPKWIAALAAVMTIAGSAGCGEEPDRELYFLGDSQIELWDVSRSFPTLQCHNFGISGSGIAELERFHDAVAGREVVLLVGTNDAWQCVGNGLDDYADRYIAAINSLGAKKIYLYSILPRTIATDAPEISEAIAKFNAVLSGRLDEVDCEVAYIDVYDRFRLGDSRMINPEYTPGGLHLNAYGYEILADELWKRLK